VNKSNRTASVGAAFFLYAALIVVIQAVRDRSFWLDEATLMENLMARSPHGILFGGALSGTQQFPKIYLALIDGVVRTMGFTTFAARLLPLGFGLAAFAVWLWLFYERYARPETQWFPFVVSCGLLVVSCYPLAYAYEFKQYSAELFFGGAMLALYQTKMFSPNKRLVLLSVVGAASLLFGYSTILVSTVVCGIAVLELTFWTQGAGNRKIAIIGFLVMTVLFLFLWRIDYQFGFQGGNGAVLHDYWTPQFAVGNTFVAKLKSLEKLYWHFLFDWWRTEWGNMCESLAAPGAWYLWPWRTFRNPDIKNTLYVLVACVLARNAWRWVSLIRRRDVLGPSLVILAAMPVLAWMHLYPWGQSRLTLYGMPLVILLMVEALAFACAVLGKFRVKPVWQGLIWVPFLWAILRSGVFMAGGFAFARLGEDLNPAIRRITPAESPFLAVGASADQVLRTYHRLPDGFRLFYDMQTSPDEMQTVVNRRPLYYIWAHNPPPRNALGVPAGDERYYHRVETLYSGDAVYGPELLLLKS